MIVSLSDIWMPEDERLRRSDNYGDIDELATRIETLGLLQDVLVAPTPADELSTASGKPWKIVDGGRRFTALSKLAAEGRKARGLDVGQITAKVEGESLDEYNSLVREFYANNDRVDFTWQEKCDFVRRVHTMQREVMGDGWSVDMTGAVLGMSKEMVYKYLQISANPEVYNDSEVKGSESFVTAYKKATILKNRRKRELAVATPAAPTPSENGDTSTPVEPVRDPSTALDLTARLLYERADARDWIKRNPENTFDYIHWDPPYGGDQDGGAHTSHERIIDTKVYAFRLMTELLPELHRTLKDGHWMCIWFYPPYAERVRMMLQGHSFIDEVCVFCNKRMDSLDLFKRCSKAPWGFWVNANPNVWYKQNRNADGHEIKRFLTNQTEMFYFCAKWENEEPTIINPNRGNVYAFDVVSGSNRRHVMHKPPALLSEIIRTISIPGELGADPSAGSGSVVEAALDMGRRIISCEISETIWLDNIGHIKDALTQKGITSLRDLKPKKVEVAT